MAPRETVGPFEFQVLSALAHKPRDAYGVTIGEWIKEQGGQAPSVGALYTTLDRLEKKGLVRSWWGEPTQARGARRKRHFAIEAAGMSAMTEYQAKMMQFSRPAGFLPQGA